MPDIKEREERKFPLLPLPPQTLTVAALRDWTWALTRELQKFFGGGALQTQQIMFREDGRQATDHDGHYAYTSAGTTVVEKCIFKANILGSDGLTASSVTTAHLQDQAVNSSKVAAGSISTTHLADGAVTTSRVAANAITQAKILDEAVSLFDATLSALLTVNASVALTTPAATLSLGASTRAVMLQNSFTFDPVTAATVLYNVHALRDGVTIESWASLKTPGGGGKDWGGFTLVDKSPTLNAAHAYTTQLFCTATSRVRSVYTAVWQLKK
jgi:hypothetical protein